MQADFHAETWTVSLTVDLIQASLFLAVAVTLFGVLYYSWPLAKNRLQASFPSYNAVCASVSAVLLGVVLYVWSLSV